MTRDPARVRGILWATEAKVTLGRRRQHTIEFDEIGEWSERKIEYVRKYVDAYSRILQRQKFHSTYIDAFAGAGVHRRKGTGELVPGSPMQVLDVTPPFDEYHFIDLDVSKLDYLKEQVGERPDVHFHAGDCNEILVSEVFPQIRYKDYRRAFCLLDPYGLHLRWEVFHEAARTGTVEILVNFSIMDLNMNVGLKNPAGIKPEQAERMTAFWESVLPAPEGWSRICLRGSATADVQHERRSAVLPGVRVAQRDGRQDHGRDITRLTSGDGDDGGHNDRMD